jgi:endo-1,4-beta-xylanase
MHDEVIPSWITKGESSITTDRAKSLFISYIQAILGRYQNKIPWWVVINEAIDDTPKNGRPLNLRDNFWLRKLGKDYLNYVFIAAHEADPAPQLFYNDYNAEGMNKKSDQVLELAKWLRSEGVTPMALDCNGTSRFPLKWNAAMSIIRMRKG